LADSELTYEHEAWLAHMANAVRRCLRDSIDDR
jgi:hypothetical protein